MVDIQRLAVPMCFWETTGAESDPRASLTTSNPSGAQYLNTKLQNTIDIYIYICNIM